MMKAKYLPARQMMTVGLILTSLMACCQATSPPSTDFADSTSFSPSWIATGEGIDNHFGYSVGTAGDVNGDGYSDVFIGADFYKSFTGRVYVYTGGSSGLSTSPIFTATGENVNSHFGYAAGTAGDVNGDGYDDIIVGAYHYRNFWGKAYVYVGSPNGLSANPLFTATGEGANNWFGRSVGTAGDVNGDGYDDIIVGAQAYKNNTGRVYVYAGSPHGLSPSPIFTATGESSSSSFGQSVGTAGDVNKDGYDDVIVGAHGYDSGTGRVYVYAGGPSGPSASPIFTVTGQNTDSRFGYAVGTAGDVNGDGYNDIIVGAYNYEDNTGRVYIYAGGSNGLNTNPLFTATGEGANNWFGRSVGTAGDTNGDGYDDILVGAQAYKNNTGRVYVYAGSPHGLRASPIFTATGEGTGDGFGKSVGEAGDVNDDGYDDIIIGAHGYSGRTGRAYVYTSVSPADSLSNSLP